MISFKRMLLVITALLLILLMGSVAFADNSQGLVTIDILTVNDFHGALAADDRNPGAVSLAGYLQARKAQNPSGTIILSAGDMFQGSPDSNLLYGKTVVEVMNAVGFDAMALGNHEFDWGVPVLKDRIAQAKFPFMAANVFDRATGKPVDFVKPYIIIEKYGVKIAVVGIITPETALTTNPKNVSSYTFGDPSETLKALIPALKAQGVEIIVVLAHLASYQDANFGEITGEAADLAREVPGISLIVSGHSHQKVSGKVDGIPVVQAANNGRFVASVHLVFSKNFREIITSSTSVDDIRTNQVQSITVKSIITKAQNEINPVKNVPLGKTVRALTHDRTELSLLGQWTTDTMRNAANADIALQNGGGLRTGIAEGLITAGTLYEVMPFDNTLYRLEMKGEQIKAALEHGIANPKYGMLQFSGINVTYDRTQPEGSRVIAATMSDGSPLDLQKIYIVATNDFLVAGGDGFSTVKGAIRAEDTFLPLREVLADAVKKIGIIDYKGDRRLEYKQEEKMPSAA